MQRRSLVTPGIGFHANGEEQTGGYGAYFDGSRNPDRELPGYTGFQQKPTSGPDAWLYPSAGMGNTRPTSSLRALQEEDIHRSEKYVSVEVASKLAGYSDPIKLVLPPAMEDAAVIYVRRKYVVGGRAAEVPERAPAPVAMVREDVKEIRLQRFGGDVDFNINSMLKPAMFKKEMDLKINAQHAALSEKLNELGYKLLMREGTSIIDALVRSTSGVSTMAADTMFTNANRYYKTQVFGALAKFEYPLFNLLATAKKCSAYDISRAVKSVLILPHGVPELMRYTTPAQMTYELSGVTKPGQKPVTLSVDGGVDMPATSSSVYVHIPPARNDYGAAMPIAGTNSLEREIYYRITNIKGGETIINLETGTKMFIEPKDGGKSVTYKIRTLSAIMAVAGSDTGNLLMQYPRTTVSTDASTESGRVALRVYMGAVLKRPDNVLVLHDVAFNGIQKCDDDTHIPADAVLIEDPIENVAQLTDDKSPHFTPNRGYMGSLDSLDGWVKLHGVQIYVDPPTIVRGEL